MLADSRAPALAQQASLRRHQLVRLTASGWSHLVSLPWGAPSRDCLVHWATHRLPLVVTRQLPDARDGHVCVGLPAPLQWQRKRIALQVPWSSVLYIDDFPAARDVLCMLPKRSRQAAQTLFAELQCADAAPRVYGSHGWQRLTGLDYLHSTSDLDLRLHVADAAAADHVVAAMASAGIDQPRLDGEVVFPNGRAVAWREWLQWRAGKVDCVLVKELHGVALHHGTAWQSDIQRC